MDHPLVQMELDLLMRERSNMEMRRSQLLYEARVIENDLMHLSWRIYEMEKQG